MSRGRRGSTSFFTIFPSREIYPDILPFQRKLSYLFSCLRENRHFEESRHRRDDEKSPFSRFLLPSVVEMTAGGVVEMTPRAASSAS